MLFKEILDVYIENHTKSMNTKCMVETAIAVPLGVKGLNTVIFKK
jgi:hypothetical protein